MIFEESWHLLPTTDFAFWEGCQMMYIIVEVYLSD